MFIKLPTLNPRNDFEFGKTKVTNGPTVCDILT